MPPSIALRDVEGIFPQDGRRRDCADAPPAVLVRFLRPQALGPVLIGNIMSWREYLKERAPLGNLFFAEEVFFVFV